MRRMRRKDGQGKYGTGSGAETAGVKDGPDGKRAGGAGSDPIHRTVAKTRRPQNPVGPLETLLPPFSAP